MSYGTIYTAFYENGLDATYVYVFDSDLSIEDTTVDFEVEMTLNNTDYGGVSATSQVF